MSWTRRTVLRALATAPASAALSACGGGPRKRTGPREKLTDGDDPSPTLREIIDDLERHYPIATGLLSQRRVGGAAVDPGEQGVNVESTASVVLRVFDGARWVERAVSDVSRTSLLAASQTLRAEAGTPRAKPAARGARQTRRFSTPLRRDPSKAPLTDWLGLAGVLFDRARKAGGSRIVYRGAYLTVDDHRIVFVGDGRDLTQRVVRTRAGAVFVASTGSATTSERAARAITGDLTAASIAPDEMVEAAERALKALTARPAIGGELEVILDPSVTALIAERCIAPALSGTEWAEGGSRLAGPLGSQLGSPLITVTDDASLEGELGTYYFDDEGWQPRRVALIDAGKITGAVTDRASSEALELTRTGHARRAGAGTRAEASNLILAAGESDVTEDMVKAVKDGVLVQGGVIARSDPRTLRFAARGARAEEIKAGRKTGRLFGDVDIIGTLPELVASTRMVSSQVDRIIGRHGAPRSIIAPYILSKALVAGG